MAANVAVMRDSDGYSADGNNGAGDCPNCNYSYWDISPNDWIVKEPWEVGVRVGVLSAIAFVGLLGNLSILLVFLKHRLLLVRAQNLFLLSMCVSDFLSLLLNPTLYIFKQKVIFRFYDKLPPFFCDITPFLIVMFLLASVFSLTAFTLNRCKGVLTGSDLFSHKGIYVTVAFIWIAAAIAASPTIVFAELQEIQWEDLLEKSCLENEATEDLRMIYWFLILGLLVWVPSITMMICYGLIFYRLKQHKRRFSYIQAHSQTSRRSNTAVRMFFLVFVVQFVSWLPWQLFELTDLLLWNDKNRHDPYNVVVSPLLHDLKFYFVFTGSAINPVLYGYCHHTIRKAFRVTFGCLFGGGTEYVLTRNASSGANDVSFSKVVSAGSRKSMDKGAGTPASKDTSSQSDDNEEIKRASEEIVLRPPLAQMKTTANSRGKRANSAGDVLDVPSGTKTTSTTTNNSRMWLPMPLRNFLVGRKKPILKKSNHNKNESRNQPSRKVSFAFAISPEVQDGDITDGPESDGAIIRARSFSQ